LAKFKKKFVRKKPKVKVKTVRKDPLYVDGERPRPMYVDYKDVELLKKLVNRHGRLVARRKTGCTAVSQHAVADAVKRARFMALMPFVGD
jgi:small subunit ribosomal protein S18